MLNYANFFKKSFDVFFEEDELSKNFQYLSKLPNRDVNCSLKIKDDMILAGLPFFFETFNYLSHQKLDYKKYLESEGKSFLKKENKTIDFILPFDVALSGERIALNLIQRASSVATLTKKYVDIAGKVKILDTRKTTPGLRALEKYAVNLGGGHNHRFSQTDCWMIKDNHKKILGGVEAAIDYFHSLNSYYQNLVVEIHDLNELKLVSHKNVKYFMLDNFSPDQVKAAIALKQEGWSYEISGGITLENLSSYVMSGVDAISTGAIIYNAPQVDLSLKFDL